MKGRDFWPKTKKCGVTNYLKDFLCIKDFSGLRGETFYSKFRVEKSLVKLGIATRTHSTVNTDTQPLH